MYLRVSKLCTSILMDLVFSQESCFWAGPLCALSRWGLWRLARGSMLCLLVTSLALLLPFAALSMYRGYGFVQYDRLEDVQAALDGEKGRLYKGYRLGKDAAPCSPPAPACLPVQRAAALELSGEMSV